MDRHVVRLLVVGHPHTIVNRFVRHDVVVRLRISTRGSHDSLYLSEVYLCVPAQGGHVCNGIRVLPSDREAQDVILPPQRKTLCPLNNYLILNVKPDSVVIEFKEERHRRIWCVHNPLVLDHRT